MSTGTIAIAGAGMAGLTCATAFAQQGWRVTIYESEPTISEDGAAIYVGLNGQRAMTAIGADDSLAKGDRMERWEYRDHRNRLMMHIGRGSPYVRRPDLIGSLERAARGAGVEIVTDREVVGADPSGALLFADGSSVDAELVIGCDGVYSKTRDAISPDAQVREVRMCAQREWLPFQVPDLKPFHGVDYWGPHRRIGFANVSQRGGTSVYFSCPAEEIEQRDGWFKLDSWVETFPHLAHLIEGISDHRPTLRYLREVQCKTWSNGRAVLIGDAAHAISQTMGQGGCLALQDAVTLAHAVGRPGDARDDAVLASRLETWESKLRPPTEMTRRWAWRFSMMATRWPTSKLALDVRSAIIWASGRRVSRITDGLCVPAAAPVAGA